MSAINKALSKRPLILRLTRFLLKRSHGNQEAVQEAIQETYLAVSRSYATFSHKSTFFTWVCKIALNKLRDYYRDQVRHESHFIVPAINTLNSIFDPNLSPEEKVTLDELPINDFEVFPVQRKAVIQPFVESWTSRPYRKGSAYFQLTKPESVQNYKQILVQEKTTGKVYSGANARQLLGLPDYEVKVSPASHDKYNIFIQSTSVNRNLVPGTLLIVLK